MAIKDNIMVQIMSIISGICLILDVLLICANIIGRMLGHPIFGTYEMVGWITAIGTGFGVAYAQACKGHVAIDNLTTRLPINWRLASEVLVYLLSIVTFALSSLKLIEYANSSYQSNSSSVSLHFHYYPVIYVLSLSMILMTIIIILQLLEAIKSRQEISARETTN